MEYSAICCRQFLQGERRAHVWKCVECQFPKCKLCDARPEMPVSHNHVEADGSWYCLMHRYPPCHICRVTARPVGAMLSKMKFTDWTCPECKDDISTCAAGRGSKPASSAQAPTSVQSASKITTQSQDSKAATSQCEATKAAAKDNREKTQSLSNTVLENRKNKTSTCNECGVVRPHTDFTFRDASRINHTGRCDFCSFPTCEFCGQKSDTAVPKEKKQPKEDGSKKCGVWFCDSKTCTNQRPRTCDVCLQMKDINLFNKYDHGQVHSSCSECEYPACHICDHVHPESEASIKKDCCSRLGSHWYCPAASCQGRLQRDARDIHAATDSHVRRLPSRERYSSFLKNTIVAMCIPLVLNVNTRLATHAAMCIQRQRPQ